MNHFVQTYLLIAKFKFYKLYTLYFVKIKFINFLYVENFEGQTNYVAEQTKTDILPHNTSYHPL